MRDLGVMLLMVLGMGCSSTTGPQLGDEFQLGVGQDALLEDVGLWVAFLGVSEDSRCPLQVMCVWAGDAAVLVETASLPDALEADSKSDTLHTNLDPKLLPLGRIELVLVRLDPYPETPSSIPLDAYIATFITRQAQ